MAAAHVSGAAALIMQREPSLSSLQVRQRLLDNAQTGVVKRGPVISTQVEFPNKLLKIPS